MFEITLPIMGTEFNVLLLIAIGFAVGVLAGFFGMGGGWVVTPALNVFGFPIPFAIGTELANITGQSALAVTKHRKMGNVDFTLGVVVGLFMIGGVEVGARVLMRLESLGLADSVVRWIYATLLGVLGAYMLANGLVSGRRRAAKAGSESDAPPGGVATRIGWLRIPPILTLKSCGVKVSLCVVAILGLLIGFLAGFMGVGGGFALVPAFVYLIGMPTFVAVGTSLLCVMISGAYGAFTYGLKGRVELIAALWMLLGAVVGAQLGASAIRYVRGSGVRFLYSLMLLLAAAGVVLKQFKRPRLAAVAILGGALFMCLVIIGRMVIAMRARRDSSEAVGGG